MNGSFRRSCDRLLKSLVLGFVGVQRRRQPAQLGQSCEEEEDDEDDEEYEEEECDETEPECVVDETPEYKYFCDPLPPCDGPQQFSQSSRETITLRAVSVSRSRKASF